MAYNKKYKKNYKPYKSSSYAPQQIGTYAYHDIDENHDWIKYMMDMNGLSNYRYASVNPNVNEGEINAPGYADGTKLMVVRYPLESFRQIGTALIVNNKENLVSDFGCAISEATAKKVGCDLNLDAVCLIEVK